MTKQEILPRVVEDDEESGVEFVDPESAMNLALAEINQQIATARRFPRITSRVQKAITDLATLDELTAEECMYSVPRAGKTIEGPSIRFAEIIQQCFGNNRVASRIVRIDLKDKVVEAEGVFFDLENNTATAARIRRRITDKHGRLLNEDMIQQTGNAAASIARRNAILGGIPRALWRQGYDAARHVIMGDIQTLGNRRARAIEAFQRFGVSAEQVFAVLEVAGIEDIRLEHMPTLTGMHSALKNKEATVEEIFAPNGKPAREFERVGNPLADDDKPAEKKGNQKKAAPKSKAKAKAEKDPAKAGEGGPAKPAAGEAPSPADAADPADPAFLAGSEAFTAGKKRSAVPADLIGTDKEAIWGAGYDAAAAVAAAGHGPADNAEEKAKPAGKEPTEEIQADREPGEEG